MQDGHPSSADTALDEARPEPGNAAGDSPLDLLTINTIRTLAIDAVEKANSGHPGAPMALAPVAYTLWSRFLNYDPAAPGWANRDRFVLSNGHASMLLYALLHLAGVKDAKEPGRLAVTLDDIKAFRQLDSKCPGHPEHGVTTGVETTTGPLGQGCGNSVGMAMAARWLAKHFNKPDFPLFDYNVYTICGDGDMMEGVASEAASLAGHLMLGNLCWIYDSNRVTIEGHTDLAFSDNVGDRFKSYGWDVHHVGDANDAERFAEAIEAFKADPSVPTLIVVDSTIGYGAPHKQGTSAAHSDALGEGEVRLTKRAYGWPEDAQFLVPDGVYDHFGGQIGQRGGRLHDNWQKMFKAYKAAYPDLAKQLELMQADALPDGWDSALPSFEADAKGLATRDSSGKAINAIGKHYPWLIGGAADLSPSTKTNMTFDGASSFEAGKYGGVNLHFGIREHVMGAIVNGLTLSKLRGYGSTFLIFSDYMKPPIRLSALMELPAIFVFTHDSIGLGEDGPTHQPVEQLLSLRSVPGLVTIRPCDANEVVEAWRVIGPLKTQPAALVLSRQPLPTLDRGVYASAKGVAKGAYVLADAKPGGRPEVILIGTGSEVALCVQVYETLAKEGVAARVVSMPSWDLFEQQDQAYRDSVLPPEVTARVSVEAGSIIGWDRYTGKDGAVIGMHTLGSSAPIKDLMKKFGFTPEKVLEAARRQIAKSKETAR
jgi:transketolase